MDNLGRVEIVCTGHEVLHGEVVNSNASWLAAACADLGFRVGRHTVVDDDLGAIGEACLAAAARADVVIVSGGLGPTDDDCTLAAVAEATQRALSEHPEARRQVEEFYLRRGARWRDAYVKQAMLPDGAEPLPNHDGSAPGVLMQIGQCLCVFLPGVPSELQQIFTATVKRRLEGLRQVGCQQVRVFKCFGMSEAQLQERVNQLALGDVQHGFRINLPEVALKLIAHGDSRTDVSAKLSHAEHILREALGPVIFGTGRETLPGVVGAQLIAQHATIAVAESCTGGQLASYLTDVPGASHYFAQGFITYSNEAKAELLGVPTKLMSTHGVVSAPVAEAMAWGARERSQSTYGIGITGIAGPGGGTDEKPRGTVYIALASARGVEVAHHVVPRPRVIFKHIVAAKALDMLRRVL